MSAEPFPNEGQQPNRFESSPHFAGLQRGQVLQSGKFVVLQPLGKGGMGAVYLAQQKLAGVDRTVVVKQLTQYYNISDPNEVQEAEDQFRREAETLVALNHPNIPQIFDYFSEENHHFIVMQYIRGISLDQLLGNKPSADTYTSRTIIECGIQICAALEYMAENGIIHHDIKPANLILDRHGVVWIVDFGTAISSKKAVQGRLGGHILGTGGYAPPEQYSGQSEPKTDVYALAATLYHLLTGDDPSGRDYRFPKLVNLDPELHTALVSALKPDVRRRASAGEFKDALQDYLSSSNASTANIRKPVGSQKTASVTIRQKTAAVAAVIVIIGIGLIVNHQLRTTDTVDSPLASPATGSRVAPIETTRVVMTKTIAPTSNNITSQALISVTPSKTSFPTRRPTSTPIGGEVQGEPRPGPSATETLPVEAATPELVIYPPILLQPVDGALVQLPIGELTLSWQYQPLTSDACFIVEIRIQDGANVTQESHCVVNPRLDFPENLANLAIGRRIEWSVAVGHLMATESPLDVGNAIPGSRSEARTFVWLGPKPIAPSVIDSPTIIP